MSKLESILIFIEKHRGVIIFIISVLISLEFINEATDLSNRAIDLLPYIETSETNVELQIWLGMIQHLQTSAYALTGLAVTVLFAGMAVGFSLQSSKNTSDILERIDRKVNDIREAIYSYEEAGAEDMDDSTPPEGVTENSN